MVKAVFEELTHARPEERFTVGIRDDVSHTRRPCDTHSTSSPTTGARRLLRPGIGRDRRRQQEHDQDPRRGRGQLSPRGTSSTTQRSRLPDGLPPPLRAGAIHAPYLVTRRATSPVTSPTARRARHPGPAAPGATFVSQLPPPPDRAWDTLPELFRSRSSTRGELYSSTPTRSPRRRGSGGSPRCCRPASSRSGVLPPEQAIARIKKAIEKTYGHRGAEVVKRNLAAVDAVAGGLHRIQTPSRSR